MRDKLGLDQKQVFGFSELLSSVKIVTEFCSINERHLLSSIVIRIMAELFLYISTS